MPNLTEEYIAGPRSETLELALLSLPGITLTTKVMLMPIRKMTGEMDAFAEVVQAATETGMWASDGVGGDETTIVPTVHSVPTQQAWALDREDYPESGAVPAPPEPPAPRELPDESWRSAVASAAPLLFVVAVAAVVIAIIGLVFVLLDNRQPVTAATISGNTVHTTPAPAASSPPATCDPGSLVVIHDQHGYPSVVCPTAATTAPPQSTLTPLQQLQAQANADAPAVALWAGSWVPQISSKQPGTRDDGIFYDYDSIWQEHTRLRQQYGARLIWADGYWVTVVDASYRDRASAQGWCDQHGRDADHCFPRMVQADAGHPLATMPPAGAVPPPQPRAPEEGGATVAKAISDQLASRNRRPDNITCPGVLHGVVGNTMRCTLTDHGQSFGVLVTVTAVQGPNDFDMHYDVDPGWPN
jgi:hypothetical protein